MCRIRGNEPYYRCYTLTKYVPPKKEVIYNVYFNCFLKFFFFFKFSDFFFFGSLIGSLIRAPLKVSLLYFVSQAVFLKWDYFSVFHEFSLIFIDCLLNVIYHAGSCR